MKAARCVALNEAEVTDYQRVGVSREQIDIIPNGISVNDNVAEENLPEICSVSQGKKVILYIGRLSSTKGLDLLIEVFSQVVRDNYSTLLVIAGPDDGYRAHLEKIVKQLDLLDCVIFTGYLSEGQKEFLYKKADVFVTLRYSGFPVTFLEAGLHGIPLLTTKKSDNLQFIPGNMGVVTDYSTSAIATGLSWLLLNDQDRVVLGSRARAFVLHNFSWESVYKKFEELYSTTISQEVS
jgi:glycosyltransferase involved in cell wall biosynthesis